MVHSLSQVSINLYILTSPSHRALLEQLVVECPYRSGLPIWIEGPVRVCATPEGYTRVVLTFKFEKDLPAEAQIDEICEYSWRIVRKFIDRLGVSMAWKLNVDNRLAIAWDEFGRSHGCSQPGAGDSRVRQEKIEKQSNR